MLRDKLRGDLQVLKGMLSYKTGIILLVDFPCLVRNISPNTYTCSLAIRWVSYHIDTECSLPVAQSNSTPHVSDKRFVSCFQEAGTYSSQ